MSVRAFALDPTTQQESRLSFSSHTPHCIGPEACIDLRAEAANLFVMWYDHLRNFRHI